MKKNQLKTIVGLCTSSLAIVQIPFVQAQIDPSNPKLNEPKQMVAHLGELPGLINADGSGPFVELVRFMDKVDPDTEIHIEVFPLHRAVHGVVNKQADFALPAIYVDDPEGKLPSYIYPALHGAYGNTFDEDIEGNTSGCIAKIGSYEGGMLHYALKGYRKEFGNMNKFHINVAESFKPHIISIECNGSPLIQSYIDGPTKALSYTVNGRPL